MSKTIKWWRQQQHDDQTDTEADIDDVTEQQDNIKGREKEKEIGENKRPDLGKISEEVIAIYYIERRHFD